MAKALVKGTMGSSGQLEGSYLEVSLFLWEMGHLRLEAIGWDVLGKGVLTPFHQQGSLGG